jgi:hypothetical protein
VRLFLSCQVVTAVSWRGCPNALHKRTLRRWSKNKGEKVASTGSTSNETKTSGPHKGWNFAVLIGVVVVPILLVFVEYLRRKDVCTPVEHCHAFDFLAPTVMAAALALVLPGMTWPAPMSELHRVPAAPCPFKIAPWTYITAWREWAKANGKARKNNRWTRFFWHGKAALAVLSGMFAIATFVAWALILDPHEGANIPDKWTTLQTTASIFYGVASVLTMAKTGLEWYGND